MAVSAHWEAHTFELPVIPKDRKWYLAFRSSDISTDVGKEYKIKDQSHIDLGPRTTAILITK